MAATASTTTAFAAPLVLGTKRSSTCINVEPAHRLPRYATPRMVQSEVKPTTSTATTKTTPATKPKTDVNLDWANLGFQYRETAGYVQCSYRNGAWGALEQIDEPYLRMHVGATALHYGQSCFEGLKAFRRADNSVGVFRVRDNAKRLCSSADRLMIPQVPEELFITAVLEAIRLNAAYVPPYGTKGALYVRPLLFGSGAKIGLQTSDEFTFLVMVTPVGDYYRGGLAPVTAALMNSHDRAAPRGVGHVKVAGNYAADLQPATQMKAAGYPINLYLDAQNRRTVEEFGTSNFFAFKDNAYVTPDSPSILPSITNRTLATLAQDFGMTVQKRPVDIDELKEFDAIGACGTAVIITAVSRIAMGDGTLLEIGDNPDVVCERMKRLYEEVRAIQYGEVEDRHGWCEIVKLD